MDNVYVCVCSVHVRVHVYLYVLVHVCVLHMYILHGGVGVIVQFVLVCVGMAWL